MVVKNTYVIWLVIVALAMSIAIPVWAQEVQPVNINTATVDELVKLDSVGPQYAARIIEYREANGAFKAPEDIMNVRGIGKKIFEKNKDRITVE